MSHLHFDRKNPRELLMVTVFISEVNARELVKSNLQGEMSDLLQSSICQLSRIFQQPATSKYHFDLNNKL